MPKVRRTIWVEKHVMVDWSPDDATMLNSGAVARMEFLKRMEEYTQNDKQTTAEYCDLIELAERAICAKYWQAEPKSAA